MPPVSWNDLIANIGTWKEGEARAVHKPLLTLMILARAQRGETNEFRFRELEVPLTKALRDFGPPRRAYHPEYPFWYLRGDGFWTIHNVAALKPDGGGEPTRRALLEKNAVAEVPAALWSQLCETSGLIAELAQQILDTFWPVSIQQAIAAQLALDLTRGARSSGGSRR